MKLNYIISVQTFLALFIFISYETKSQDGVGVNTNIPKSSIDIKGSFGKNVTAITSSITLTPSHATVLCNNVGAIAVTLPAASTCPKRIYEVKRSSSSTGVVTVSGIIDGTTDYLLNYANQSITVFSDSVNWHSRDGSGDNTSWKLTGNSGTSATTNFVGTIDSVDFLVKTKNTERVRVLASGNVGINRTAPNAKLHINESSSTLNTMPVIIQNAGGNGAGTEATLRLSPSTAETVRGVDISAIQIGFNDIDLKISLGGSSGATAGVCPCPPTEKIRISSDGQVGIGVTTPAAYLDVDGKSNASAFRLRGTAETVEITDMYIGAAGNFILDNTKGTGTSAFIDLRSENNMFGVVIRESMGIVTGSYANLYVTDVVAPGLDYLTIKVTGAYATDGVHFASNENMGMGVTAPTYKISLNGNAQETIGMERHTTAASSGNILQILSGGSFTGGTDLNGGELKLSSGTSTGTGTSNLTFYTSTAGATGVADNAPTQKMTILGSGNVGIGNAGPIVALDILNNATGTTGSVKLHLARIGAGDVGLSLNQIGVKSYGIVLRDITTATGTPGRISFVDSYFPGGAGNEMMCIGPFPSGGNVGIGCNNPKFKLHVIGDIASSATVRTTNVLVTGAITACSDIRYKKDIKQLTNSLQNILKLTGVNYTWKTSEFPDKHFTDLIQIGVIAQELEKIYPELVVTDTDGYKSVEYSKLTPILLEAIKQQQQMILSQNSLLEDLLSSSQSDKKAIKELESKISIIEQYISVSAKK